jgi:L-ascorbate metabolism protein UlaG (beta-lactamase superfamily)
MRQRLNGLLLAVPFVLSLTAAPVLADACIGPIARAPLKAPILAPMAAPDGTPISLAALQNGEVRITYIGHSTFTIESPAGVVAATDYNDYVRPTETPTIATMNHAHLTHYTNRPDPAIRHVLRGWAYQGKSPSFDLMEKDVRVRNVPTNIRNYGGTELSGNSIFIFEIGGLCIAHLGHLHHTLTPEHVKAVGEVDVLMAAVDGSMTLDHDGIVEVIGQLKPKLLIPMHFITSGSLMRFLDRMGGRYPVEQKGDVSIVISRANLPTTTAIMVLRGY